MKLPKNMIRRLKQDEMLEMWDSRIQEWIKIPIDPTDPDIVKLKEYMKAEFEIRCVIEGMKIGVIKENNELD